MTRFPRPALVFSLAFFGLLWLKGLIFLDPDFGYRLRTGGLILSQGFPRTDPYSYTMPSFAYVEHAWLTGVSWALLYPIIGQIGLAAIWAALTLLALTISLYRTKPPLFSPLLDKNLSFFSSPVFLLALAVILPFAGVRAQVVTWLMLAILLRIVLSARVFSRWRLILPAFFWLWANLHGGFASGLAAFFLVIVLRAWRKKRLDKTDIFILVSSVAATLINPYGFGTWREVWASISDSALRWNIAEWMPGIFMVDLALPALVAFSFLLIWRQKSRFAWEELGLYFVFLAQGLGSRRHLPLWVIVALPMTRQAIGYFYQEIVSLTEGKARFKKAYRFVWFGSLAILLMQSVVSLQDAWFLSESQFYPQKATVYLKGNMPAGEIFSQYGWGGYLIWKLPEKKVFIDGRMPSWRWQEYPPGETGSAFGDYLGLLRGEVVYEEVFEKYAVNTVLWPVPAGPSLYDRLEEKVADFLARLGKEKKEFNLLAALEAGDWQKVYQDSVALIYQRPE